MIFFPLRKKWKKQLHADIFLFAKMGKGDQIQKGDWSYGVSELQRVVHFCLF